jgi:chorismate synthase
VREKEIRADAWVHVTYGGDLAAVAGVPFGVGRESREEYGERYADRVFTDAGSVSALRPGSTGEAGG